MLAACNVSVYPGTYIARSLKKSAHSGSYVSLVTSDLHGSHQTQELVHVFCAIQQRTTDRSVEAVAVSGIVEAYSEHSGLVGAPVAFCAIGSALPPQFKH